MLVGGDAVGVVVDDGAGCGRRRGRSPCRGVTSMQGDGAGRRGPGWAISLGERAGGVVEVEHVAVEAEQEEEHGRRPGPG